MHLFLVALVLWCWYVCRRAHASCTASPPLTLEKYSFSQIDFQNHCQTFFNCRKTMIVSIKIQKTNSKQPLQLYITWATILCYFWSIFDRYFKIIFHNTEKQFIFRCYWQLAHYDYICILRRIKGFWLVSKRSFRRGEGVIGFLTGLSCDSCTRPT